MRQGDPIILLLFNIIFDPFLRAINQDLVIILGFDFQHIAASCAINPTSLTDHIFPANPVKVLAYADDTLVFLNDLSEFHQLQFFIGKYASASNASFNYHKSQALLLSGESHESWVAGLRDSGIPSWHDKSASALITYLGYPICASINQRKSYLTALLYRLKDLCRLHSDGNLTFWGRVTVLNLLL